MSIFHYFAIALFLISCQGHRNRVDSSAQKVQPFQLPFFNDADSLSRELGLLRLRQLEDNDDVVVLAQLSAGYTLQAMMARAEDSQRSLELAKQYGIQCLRTSSGFESLLQSRGLRITPKAVNILDDEPHLKHCRRWTGIAWSLWLLERGVLGASIDVKSVQAMAPKQPKSSFDHYQVALMHALDLDETKNDAIQEALQSALERSIIPNRMHYEQWRLIKQEVSTDWRELIADKELSSLSALEREAILRAFPEAFGP